MNDALIVSGLTKTYKDFMLNEVSFSVPCGSIVGLIGENGAGKVQLSMQCWDLFRKRLAAFAFWVKSS